MHLHSGIERDAFEAPLARITTGLLNIYSYQRTVCLISAHATSPRVTISGLPLRRSSFFAALIRVQWQLPCRLCSFVLHTILAIQLGTADT